VNSETMGIFSEEEKEILQEIMNIAFGNATADLAEAIDIFVVLSVPNIRVINIGELSEYLRANIEDSSETTIVDQKFQGDFSGSGFLVFPTGAKGNLISLLEDETVGASQNSTESKPIMEKEFITEISNILIGACVGKMTELLNTFVTYSPPTIMQGNSNEYRFMIDNFDPKQSAIAMKTVFQFKQKNIEGFLLILTDQMSIGWLRKSLNDFMKSYE